MYIYIYIYIYVCIHTNTTNFAKDMQSYNTLYKKSNDNNNYNSSLYLINSSRLMVSFSVEKV